MEVLIWISDHAVDIYAAFGLVAALATVVARLTPTPKDDKLISKVIDVVKQFGFHGLVK